MFGSEKDRWLTTESSFLLKIIRAYWSNIETLTTGYFQSQHYSKEVFTWCYRKPLLVCFKQDVNLNCVFLKVWDYSKTIKYYFCLWLRSISFPGSTLAQSVSPWHELIKQSHCPLVVMACISGHPQVTRSTSRALGTDLGEHRQSYFNVSGQTRVDQGKLNQRTLREVL